MITLNECLYELKRELAMRRRVWRNENGIFLKPEHQMQYDRLERVYRVLSLLSPQEWKAIAARWDRKDEGKQTKLFK